MNLVEFNQKIVPLKDKLFRFASRIVGNRHEAEDVVQEVLEKIWSKRDSDKLAGVENWEAWCMTMTRNLSIDRTRSKYRTVVVALPEKFEAGSSTRNAQNDLETNETFAKVRQIMAVLPEKQRSVMHLRDIEDRSYDEISEILNISPEDVKISLHRARKFVRSQLFEV